MMNDNDNDNDNDYSLFSIFVLYLTLKYNLII